MRVGAQFFDIDVDAEAGRGRQIDPAFLDREPGQAMSRQIARN